MQSGTKTFTLLSLMVILVLLLVSPAVAATFQLSGQVTSRSGSSLANTMVEVLDPNSVNAVPQNYSSERVILTGGEIGNGGGLWIYNQNIPVILLDSIGNKWLFHLGKAVLTLWFGLGGQRKVKA
ncbi:MAG: hypothetical protein HYR94_26420 [Chloroflexi bacterium]|nr:hypothetical protein [Chloroflexota bacterium]